MGYCGCGTRANKGRWALVCAFLVLALIFLVVNIAVSSQCEECYYQGSRKVCDEPKFDANRDWGNIEGCSEGAVVSTSFLFFIALIAAIVPCCCMCCCAVPPKEEPTYAVAVVHKPGEPAPGPYGYAQGPPPNGAPYAVGEPTPPPYGPPPPNGAPPPQNPGAHSVI